MDSDDDIAVSLQSLSSLLSPTTSEFAALDTDEQKARNLIAGYTRQAATDNTAEIVLGFIEHFAFTYRI